MFGPNTRRTPGQTVGSETQTGKGTGKNNRRSRAQQQVDESGRSENTSHRRRQRDDQEAQRPVSESERTPNPEQYAQAQTYTSHDPLSNHDPWAGATYGAWTRVEQESQGNVWSGYVGTGQNTGGQSGTEYYDLSGGESGGRSATNPFRDVYKPAFQSQCIRDPGFFQQPFSKNPDQSGTPYPQSKAYAQPVSGNAYAQPCSYNAYTQPCSYNAYAQPCYPQNPYSNSNGTYDHVSANPNPYSTQSQQSPYPGHSSCNAYSEQTPTFAPEMHSNSQYPINPLNANAASFLPCLLYTSDAADE